MNPLPFVIKQVYANGELESYIAAFQHLGLAQRFKDQLEPISECRLEVERIEW